MITIQDRLYAINEQLEGLHREFARIKSDKDALSASGQGAKERVAEQLRTRREAIAAQREDVEMYYRIARENSHRDYPAQSVPVKPDIVKLNDLVSRVSPCSRDDASAAEAIGLAGKYLAWLDAEDKKLDQEAESLLSREVNAVKLKQDSLDSRRRSVIDRCLRYLDGDDISSLVRLFNQIDADYGIDERTFKEWGAGLRKRKRMILVGYKDFHLDTPKKLRSKLKDRLGDHYDEQNGNVNCPCGFTITSYKDIFVEYTDRNEADAKRGAQALIVNFMRHIPAQELRVTVFDNVRYSASILGPLSLLAGEKGSMIEGVSNNEESAKSAKTALCEYYRKVEQKIGAKSVHQYNASVEPANRIPYRVLVTNNVARTFSQDNNSDLSYVLNNADRFGLFVIRLEKSENGGSKGTDREAKYLVQSKDMVRIISDQSGFFYIENDIEGVRFRWPAMPVSVPDSYIQAIVDAARPAELGTEYFKRYPAHLPKRSQSARKEITIPFAVDGDDSPMHCSFENENFAAYIMGAAGSGKSTLLHTIITGLLMNYHPDEVELWLMDFKMTEFRLYGEMNPPHVRYVLLEKSEDLIFDIVDRLTNELERRERFFANNDWKKLTDVPLDKHVPAVFVIIDEFAQMSQILKDTSGSGHGSDYTLKLENLLSKGRALGFKFIFASQTYTSGVSGLTETAMKQIQMRFAMKNTTEEIKQTLALSSHELTDDVRCQMASLPPYQTLFKYRDSSNCVRVGLFNNMYVEEGTHRKLVTKLKTAFKPVQNEPCGECEYLDKGFLFVDGTVPRTFKSQISLYKSFEHTLDPVDIDEEDAFIYPGVPCSFDAVRPFVVYSGGNENILLAAGSKEELASVAASILSSWMRRGRSVALWAHDRAPVWRRYRNSTFGKYDSVTTIPDICSQAELLMAAVKSRSASETLVACFGLERLFAEMELYSEIDMDSDGVQLSAAGSSGLTAEDVFNRAFACTDPEEKARLIEEYNKMVEEYNAKEAESKAAAAPAVFDARETINWLLKTGPMQGVHFLLVFEQPGDFISLKLSKGLFRHKLFFAMSRDDSLELMGNRAASQVEQGRFVYSDGKSTYTLRPHLHPSVPLNGYEMLPDGSVHERKG